MMQLSRSTRRLVACLIAAFMLLCQSAAIAQACLAQPVDTGAAAVEQPCHGMGNGTEPDSAAVSGSCQHVSPGSSGFTVFAAADMPVGTVLVAHASAPATQPAFADASLLRVGLPPPRILNCCLRN
jgi:hypothetical protein